MAFAMVLSSSWLVGWAAILLVVGYGFSLVGADTVDLRAALVAAAVYLMVEAAYVSLERRRRLVGPGGFALREVLRVGVLTAASFVLAAVILALVSVPIAYGILVQVAGVGAAAAVLATLVLLVRQRA